MSRSTSNQITKIAYPAGTSKMSEREIFRYQQEIEEYRSKYDVEVYQDNGAKGDTRFLSPSRDGSLFLEGLRIAPKLSESEKIDVIVLEARGNDEKAQQVHQDLVKVVDDFKEKGINAAAFIHNARGVQGSSGKVSNKHDLVDDFDALYKLAKEKYPGVPIIIKAHSIGTGVVSEWAAKKLEPKEAENIKLMWLGRGFNEIANVATQGIPVLKTVFNVALQLAQWKIDTRKNIISMKKEGGPKAKIPIIAFDANGDTVIKEVSKLGNSLIEDNAISILTPTSDGFDEIQSKELRKKKILFSPKITAHKMIEWLEVWLSPDVYSKERMDYFKEVGINLNQEQTEKISFFQGMIIPKLKNDNYLYVENLIQGLDKVLEGFKQDREKRKKIQANLYSGFSPQEREQEAIKFDKENPNVDDFPKEAFLKMIQKMNENFSKGAHGTLLSDLYNEEGESAQKLFIEQGVAQLKLSLSHKEKEKQGEIRGILKKSNAEEDPEDKKKHGKRVRFQKDSEVEDSEEEEESAQPDDLVDNHDVPTSSDPVSTKVDTTSKQKPQATNPSSSDSSVLPKVDVPSEKEKLLKASSSDPVASVVNNPGARAALARVTGGALHSETKQYKHTYTKIRDQVEKIFDALKEGKHSVLNMNKKETEANSAGKEIEIKNRYDGGVQTILNIIQLEEAIKKRFKKEKYWRIPNQEVVSGNNPLTEKEITDLAKNGCSAIEEMNIGTLTNTWNQLGINKNPNIDNKYFIAESFASYLLGLPKRIKSADLLGEKELKNIYDFSVLLYNASEEKLGVLKRMSTAKSDVQNAVKDFLALFIKDPVANALFQSEDFKGNRPPNKGSLYRRAEELEKNTDTDGDHPHITTKG